MDTGKVALALVMGLSAVECTADSSDGFTVTGNVNLPDGYAVSICCRTDTAYSVEVADGVISNGTFCLKGKIGKPQPGTLMTNNMRLVEQNHWPVDSIRWTYTEIFLSDDDIAVDKDFHISGGQIQTDFNDYQALKRQLAGRQQSISLAGAGKTAEELFIDSHPRSVISLWLANKMLQRGYNLTAGQISHLENTIHATVPVDTARQNEFRTRIAFAKKTVKGGKVVDLELSDIDGNICRLTDIIPRNKYVLVDFWASWCGICIAAMPEIKKLADRYKDKFEVIAVSIDTKREAWKKAMERHPEPWPQYVTTPQGYDDLFHKYQIGNGVPYYIMITPDGNVLNSPSNPDAVREILDKYN